MLQQGLAGAALQRCKKQLSRSILPDQEVDGAVAEIANAIEQYNGPCCGVHERVVNAGKQNAEPKVRHFEKIISKRSGKVVKNLLHVFVLFQFVDQLQHILRLFFVQFYCG